MPGALSSIRGQLVLWYLGVLAALLLGVGIFQSVTLASYLRTTTADSLGDAARSELAVLGPCYIRSSRDLERNAQRLALLLGSREVGVKIVAADGVTLADHGLGEPGTTQAMRLSAATIRRLIVLAKPPSHQSRSAAQTCRPVEIPHPGNRHLHHPPVTHAAILQGDLLLTAVPLARRAHVLGYALLGRSMTQANATIRETRLVSALGALLALMLAALVALPIINRAMRPLRHVAQTASAIAAGDLAKRANLAVSRDEIARLGQAFDTMVDRLQAALDAAKESEDNMRRFLADASHELRTPITALRGTSEVLLRQGETGRPEVDLSLRSLHVEAVRLSRLVDDLLTLSRLDAGQELDPQPVKVKTFLTTFVAHYADVWPERTITVDSGLANGMTAHVDPEALTRVLTNLVDNAAKHSRLNGRILITATDSDSTSITIAVSDEGPGLDPDDVEHVFERFYRASKSRSRQNGGSGLGLAIVGALVKESRGHVDIETGRDKGTTVTVTIPRVRDNSP